MSLPEISRRCLKCGAAVRAGARFCPQCGQEFREAGQSQTSVVGGARAADPHGEGGGAADGGVESLAARLSAELDGGGAPKTRDLEVGRDAAPPTRDVYVPALEGEHAIEREHAVGSGAVGAASPMPGAGETAAVAVNASAVEGDAASPSDDGRGRVERVRENTRARVESTKARAVKMRDEALVVLEETPDDSGLRFVVVAVAVFLLFILFLFFSTSVL